MPGLLHLQGCASGPPCHLRAIAALIGGAPRPGKECTTLIVVTHEQVQVELVLDLNDQVV
jgi:hypothetical protein